MVFFNPACEKLDGHGGLEITKSEESVGYELEMFWLVVEPSPSEKHESIGMMTFHISGNMKNVPNHQPVFFCMMNESHPGSLHEI